MYSTICLLVLSEAAAEQNLDTMDYSGDSVKGEREREREREEVFAK